ncbi:MAG: hypothetical protein ABSD46_09305 [Bacteroidota bacterium]
MTKNQTVKPKAFVLMPFDEAFKEIYELFVTQTLSEAGYDVKRADDIKNSQNILKDIVHGIAKSDLIVVDLTDSNPNVYYELGLAHALCKPTILLTQNIKDLPFDLRSYRVISYSTHFVELARAKTEVLSLAQGLLTGDASFGGPVTDFLPEIDRSPKTQVLENADQGEPGFLDHLMAMIEGFESLTEIASTFSSETQQLTEKTNDVTLQIQSLVSNPQTGSVRQMHALVTGQAQTLVTYSKSLSSNNDLYSEALVKTRAALEAIVRAQEPKTPEERVQLQSFLDNLTSMQEGTQAALNGVNSMTDTLRQLPSVERTFNRARDQAVRELQRLSDNLEQTNSMTIRAKEIGELKIKMIEQKSAG